MRVGLSFLERIYHGISNCRTRQANNKKEEFGIATDGRAVEIYTLTNSGGAEARITTYGGAVVSLIVPDRNGQLGDVVLGFDSLSGYERHHSFFGGLIGRYANRIAKGRFVLDGTPYQLATNNGENHLHGGTVGFNRAIWSGQPSVSDDGAHLELAAFQPRRRRRLSRKFECSGDLYADRTQ